MNLRWTLLPLISALPAALPGAELVIRDLQASLLFEPTSYDYQLDSSTIHRSGSDGFDTALGLDLGGRYSFSRPGDPFGLTTGLDLVVAQSSNNVSSLRTVSGRALVGGAYALNDLWLVGIEGGMGYGLSHLDLSATNAYPDFSADGRTTSTLVRADVGYQFAERWRVGLCVGYEWASHRFSADDLDLRLDQNGMTIGLQCSYSWSRNPVLVK